MRGEALDPSLMKTLDAVAVEKSFTKAGERLGLTQQAVSAQMKRLEGLVGRQLFVRGEGMLRLSADGETLLLYGRRAMRIAEGVQQHFAGVPIAGTIRFGIVEVFAGFGLPLILSALKRQCPRVKVVVEVAQVNQLVAGLEAGRLDVMLGAQRHEQRRGLTLWSERLEWVGDVELWRGRSTPVGLVSRPEPSFVRSMMVEALINAGQAYEILFESDSLYSIRVAVANGIGIGAICVSAIERENVIGSVLPDMGSFEFYLRANDEDRPYVRSFVKLLQEYGRQRTAALYPTALA